MFRFVHTPFVNAHSFKYGLAYSEQVNEGLLLPFKRTCIFYAYLLENFRKGVSMMTIMQCQLQAHLLMMIDEVPGFT